MTPLSNSTISPTVEERVESLEKELIEIRARLEKTERNSISLEMLFRPWVSFLGACIFTTALLLFCFAMFSGETLRHYVTYMVPIAFPFTGFCFDRAQGYIQSSSKKRLGLALGVDAFALIPALIRAFYAIPYISGHALFLAFALITTKSAWTRIATAIVLAEVIYLKFFVWHDATLYGGMLIGVVMGGFWWVAIGSLFRFIPSSAER